MNYTFTKEDVEMVEKFIEIRKKGFYADGGQVTEIYNRVLNKHVNSTSCGACIRNRINELETALNHFKNVSQRLSEASKQEEPATTKVEENKAVRRENKKVKK